jgi:hypothetical protein
MKEQILGQRSLARLLVVLGACALAIGIVPIRAVFIDQWRRSVEELM